MRKTRHFALRNAAFYVVVDGLWHSKRPSFAVFLTGNYAVKRCFNVAHLNIKRA